MVSNVPGKQRRIEEWIDGKVVPSLRVVKKSTENLVLSLNEIPKIGNRDQLQFIANQRGSVDDLD